MKLLLTLISPAEAFKDNMTDFEENISKIYATRGILVEINTTLNASSNTANITMCYYDGKVNFTLGTTLNRDI
jgi:histidinol phosphatase-like PHP family hydrolase